MKILVGGECHGRDAALAWEAKRMKAVRRKLGLPRSDAPLPDQRRELTDHKISLGHDGIRRALGMGPRITELIARLTVKLSRGKRRFSICEIEVPAGSAEQFARWFEERNEIDDERAMIDACPDHYIISRDHLGRQFVLETTGGSPLPGAFLVDYEDVGSLVTPADPDFPYQVAGVAKLDDGLAVGGVRHQFRQEGNGFRAKLTVEFPGGFPKTMVHEHCWHLAVEFSNWIEAAAG